MKCNSFFILLLFFGVLSTAQTESNDVLFTIDNQEYTADEFKRVYQKNIDLVKDESQKDIDQYLQLYIAYKLKVNKANELGLDEKSQFKSELTSYRSQLAKKYLLDKKVTQELVEEGYNRLKKEVRASHILLRVDEYASPEDTLKAYNKLLELKVRAEKGESFSTMAENYSEDPSAKQNKGDLGYFTAFKMVYPFENAAYTTPVGGISMPVRTKFGYHIVKVDDVRPSRGEAIAAHIMLFKKEKDTATFKPKDKIYDIYLKLKQGEKFETLAKNYSEDGASASNGGKLEKFGTGEVGSVPFEDAVFSLEKPGDYSEPFETIYGWHIVKLIEKIPLQSFEELESKIKFKVLRDDRSVVLKNTLTEKLQAKYKVTHNKKMFNEVGKVFTDKFYNKSWSTPEKYKYDAEVLLKLDTLDIKVKEFLNYLYAQQNSDIAIKPKEKLLDFLYDKYIKEQLNLYYTNNLEEEMPEFKSVMTEYKEGILLFDLMSENVWSKAKKDTLGLKAFYEKNKENYKWGVRYDVKIISSTDLKVIKKSRKYLTKGKGVEYIRRAFNTEQENKVMIEEGIFEDGSQKLPKSYVYVDGVSDIIEEGDYFYILVGKEKLPASVKELDETKGQVISDYQQFLEKQWVEEMKAKSTITINEGVLDKVKKSLQ